MEYKIITKFLKDVSFEIPDVETFMHFQDNIEKYNLDVNIISKALKKGLVQVDLIFNFKNDKQDKKKASVEITYSSVINIQGKLENKEELKKILLVKVPNEVYPFAFEIFSELIEKSGLKNIKPQKKIDFEELYNKNLNKTKNDSF